MKLQAVGFEWRLSGVLGFDRFEKHLQAQCGKELKFQGYRRFLHCGRIGDLLAGAFVTVKNQRKFTAFNLAAKQLTVRDLGGGHALADFNFFAVNTRPVNQAHPGLYLHYFPSCGVGSFCEFVYREYDQLREAMIAHETGEAAASDPPRLKAAKAAAERKYGTRLDYAQMVRPEAWPELLAEFSRLRACELVLNTDQAAETWAYPAKGDLKRQTTRLSFLPTASVTDLVANLPAYIRKVGAKGGRFEGLDRSGAERVVRMIETPDVFAVWEGEQHLDARLIDYQDVTASPLLGMMIEEMKRYPLRFGRL